MVHLRSSRLLVKVRQPDLSPTPQAKRVFGLPSNHLLSLLKIVVALFSNTFEGASTEFDTDELLYLTCTQRGEGM